MFYILWGKKRRTGNCTGSPQEEWGGLCVIITYLFPSHWSEKWPRQHRSLGNPRCLWSLSGLCVHGDGSSLPGVRQLGRAFLTRHLRPGLCSYAGQTWSRRRSSSSPWRPQEDSGDSGSARPPWSSLVSSREERTLPISPLYPCPVVLPASSRRRPGTTELHRSPCTLCPVCLHCHTALCVHPTKVPRL